MSTFRDRLEEEITRIGGVTAIANTLGVARNTIYNWMAKANVPLGDLMAMKGVLGLDAIYVITGSRTSEALPAEEHLLLERYRGSTPALREAAMRVLAGVMPAEGGVTQNFSGKVEGGVAARDIVVRGSRRKRE